ncbi:MAG: hypothetical protein WCV55_02825 [Candidatus Paceibacterota bacterium]
MNTPNLAEDEDLRDYYRSQQRHQPQGVEMSIGEVTIWDLIVGPDSELGPDQIALREYLIDRTINGNLMRISATFNKEADKQARNDLAKEILKMLLISDRSMMKVILTEKDLQD